LGDPSIPQPAEPPNIGSRMSMAASRWVSSSGDRSHPGLSCAQAAPGRAQAISDISRWVLAFCGSHSRASHLLRLLGQVPRPDGCRSRAALPRFLPEPRRGPHRIGARPRLWHRYDRHRPGGRRDRAGRRGGRVRRDVAGRQGKSESLEWVQGHLRLPPWPGRSTASYAASTPFSTCWQTRICGGRSPRRRSARAERGVRLRPLAAEPRLHAHASDQSPRPVRDRRPRATPGDPRGHPA
jgi:hypothetical protein